MSLLTPLTRFLLRIAFCIFLMFSPFTYDYCFLPLKWVRKVVFGPSYNHSLPSHCVWPKFEIEENVLNSIIKLLQRQCKSVKIFAETRNYTILHHKSKPFLIVSLNTRAKFTFNLLNKGITTEKLFLAVEKKSLKFGRQYASAR